jgi:SAM-dependent methyltransferase
MPTSDPHNINPILSVMINLNPGSVLDIGCGFGKYGVLLREYLDIWHERLERDQWRVRIEAIEAFEGYRNPIHDFVYNQVHYGRAQERLPELGRFDAILIADVIEHLEKAEAVALVSECFRHAPVVVVSTPREFFAQGAVLANPYEVHRSHFAQADFPNEVGVRVIRALSCDVFIASKTPLKPEVFALTEPADFIYLRSRKKLGGVGLPVSLVLRGLCRWLG